MDRAIMKMRLYKFLKIWNIKSISSKSMKWSFLKTWNTGWASSRKHQTATLYFQLNEFEQLKDILFPIKWSWKIERYAHLLGDTPRTPKKAKPNQSRRPKWISWQIGVWGSLPIHLQRYFGKRERQLAPRIYSYPRNTRQLQSPLFEKQQCLHFYDFGG